MSEKKQEQQTLESDPKRLQTLKLSGTKYDKIMFSIFKDIIQDIFKTERMRQI